MPDASLPRLEDRPLVRALRGVNRLFCTTYQQLHVQSPCRLPRYGPAILVCNHTSGLDPLLLQATANRVIVWMMAKEYYEIGALQWFFRTIEAIPVARDGRDSAGTRAALRALHAGNVLGIFPEGRIAPDQALLPFQTGVAMLAIKTGVPVHTAYLDGSQRGQDMLQGFKTANRAYVRFGNELNIPRDNTSRQTLDAATEVIRNSVDELRLKTHRTISRGLFR